MHALTAFYCVLWMLSGVFHCEARCSTTEHFPCKDNNNALDESTTRNILSQQHFEKCAKGDCDNDYWRMNLTIRRSQNASPYPGNATCQMKVIYHLECAESEDIVAFQAKKELSSIENLMPGTCSPRSDIRSCTNPPTPLHKCNLTFSNETSERGYKLTVTLKSNSTRYAAAASVTTIQTERRFKDYFLCENTPIVIVDVSHKDNTLVLFSVIQEHPLKCIEKTIRIRRVSHICALFNTSSLLWNSSVCEEANVLGNKTECLCHHNSAFAVIFSLTTIKIDDALMKTSMTCEIASIISLFIAPILLFLYRRKMRNFDRVLVQINLCLSLAMMHVFLLLSQAAITNNAFCQAAIVLSHYFLVTSTTFMVMEGSLILIKVLIPNFGGSSKSRRVKGFVIGWIVPMVYVTICAGIGIKNSSYGNFIVEADRFEVCWITDSLNLVVIVPIAIGLTINIAIIIRLGVLVRNLSKKAENFKPTNERDYSPLTHAKKAIRGVIILCPILGIPWILGFFINIGHPADVVFAWINAIVNGCQGIYIFLHYVAFNSDMKENLKRSWKNANPETTTIHQLVFLTNKSKD